MTESKIEWTDRSDWNPVRGCTRVSPGCGGPGPDGGCYAEAMAARFSKPGMWGHGFAEMRDGKPRWTGKVEFQEDRLTLPLNWRKPAKIFVSSTSDIFHESLPDEAIDKLFAVMALCPQHTFQVLTKRAERMRDYFLKIASDQKAADDDPQCVPQRFDEIAVALTNSPCAAGAIEEVAWPLPNVWLGVSCERQQEADERIPLLLQTPAAIRFISAEPLLGPIDLHQAIYVGRDGGIEYVGSERQMLDWVIVGGESGSRARPMHPQWARDIRDQCQAAGVKFFFKQWAAWLPAGQAQGLEHHGTEEDGRLVHLQKKLAGRLLDGVEHNEFPVRP